MHAAGADIGRMHAAAACPLVEHHQLLAFLEAPERRRQRADIHGLRGDVEEMREEAADLGIEHADELGAHRYRHADELLHRERIGVLLVHRRHVIEAVEIGQRLEIGLVLDQLLGAAVQQPDMRVDALDDFAVELEHEAQHAMRRRVLRPEIDGELAVVAFTLTALGLGVRGVCLSRPSCVHLGSAFAVLAATDLLKRSQVTMNRSWIPAPISSMPSCALTLNLARGPLTSMHSASTVMVKPTGVAALCDTSIWTPRLPSPGSRWGPSSCTQVHSMRPTMKPVANTSGMAESSGNSSIEMRHRLRNGHRVGEAVREAWQKSRLHGLASLSGRLASPAFSSPGMAVSMPSHGLRKSKLRNSCISFTGSYTTRFSSSS